MKSKALVPPRKKDALRQAVQTGERGAGFRQKPKPSDSYSVDELRRMAKAGMSVSEAVKRDEQRNTAHDQLIMGCENQRLGDVKSALERGADPNRPERSTGYTPLMKVLRGKADILIVNHLVENGADVTICARETNFTALHFAAIWGHNTAIKYLIDHGADVNAVTAAGAKTPLMSTCELTWVQDDGKRVGRYLLTVSALLENGADTTLVNTKGKTTLQILEEARIKLRGKLPSDRIEKVNKLIDKIAEKLQTAMES